MEPEAVLGPEVVDVLSGESNRKWAAVVPTTLTLLPDRVAVAPGKSASSA
jgi:hypothetical protein